MRRLSRILLDGATVLSLVLLVATIIAWARSYGRRYGCELFFRKDVVNALVYQGDLWIERYFPDSAISLPERDWGWNVPYVASYRHFEGKWQRSTDLLVSSWVLVAVFAPLPLIRSLKLYRRWTRRSRRRMHGLCASCGYDLRASPERCPECGVVATGVKS
jgi:hypothetical protein